MYEYPDYEDFYEPSEFDMQVEEFKNILRQSVSKDWVDKMNTLEKENAELQEVKKNFETIKKDYKNKKIECKEKAEEAIKNAEYNARNSRLKELMQDLQCVYFKVSDTYKYGKKCDKCDNKRRVHYKTPSGKNATEICECAKEFRILIPQKMVIYELSLRDNGNISAWFIPKRNSSGDNYYIQTDCFTDKIVVEDDEDITKLETEEGNNLYFRTLEKCQEYCDWYNKNILGVNVEELCEM